MAKVTLKGIEALRKRLGAKFKIAINKTLRDKGLRESVGQIVADDIRKTFNKTPAAATKAWRSYLEQFNTTHPDYSRNKINITFSGDLLTDLATNVKADTTKLQLIFEHSDKKHKKYKVAKGLSKGSAKSHKQIQGYLSDMDYDYLEISQKAASKITDEIQKVLLKYVLQVTQT